MTEQNGPSKAEPTPTADGKPEPSFSAQRIYLKDLSFETPKGAEVFQKQWKPRVNQDLSTHSSQLDSSLFEVSLRLTVTVKHEEETLYLVEVDQAGIFKIAGLDEKQLAQVLNTTCPSMLFPYAREVIDNTLTKGTFPPLMIPPVNFDALFSTAVAAAQVKEDADGVARSSDTSGEQTQH